MEQYKLSIINKINELAAHPTPFNISTINILMQILNNLPATSK